MTIPDCDIVIRVLDGEKEAYAELVRRYHPKTIGLCRSFLLSEALAEDAAQDIFVKAYEGLRSYQRKSSFGTWIYRIAYNHCLDVLRTRKRQRADSLDASLDNNRTEINLVSPFPDTALENQDLVRRILAGMTEDERVIVSLRELTGLNYGEIAQALGVSTGAVKSRLKRARKKMLKIGRHFLKVQNV